MTIKKHGTDDQSFYILVPGWLDAGDEVAFTAWLSERGVSNPTYEEVLELEDRDLDAAMALQSELARWRDEFHGSLYEAALEGTDEVKWLLARGYPFERRSKDVDGAGRSWLEIRIPERNQAFQFKLQAETASRTS